MASKHKHDIDLTIVYKIKSNRKDSRFKTKYTDNMIREMLTLRDKHKLNHSEISKYMEEKYKLSPQPAYVKKLITKYESTSGEQTNQQPENENIHETFKDNFEADAFAKDLPDEYESKTTMHRDASQNQSHNTPNSIDSESFDNGTIKSIEKVGRSSDKKKEYETIAVRKKYLLDRKRSGHELTLQERQELWKYTSIRENIARGQED